MSRTSKRKPRDRVKVVALVLVALGGTAVALLVDPLRQVLVLGIYGLALTVLFFTLQAPDVALSEIVVGSLAMPVIILATLRKLRENDRTREEEPEE